MYDALLATHVLAAVLWVGGGVSVHVLARRALASRDDARVVAHLRDANAIGNRLYAPLSLILLIAGILLVDEAGYEFSQLWITLGFAAWIVSFAIGAGFYGRQMLRLEEIVAADGVHAPGVRAIADRIVLVNSIEITILVLVVVDMAVKPGV